MKSTYQGTKQKQLHNEFLVCKPSPSTELPNQCAAKQSKACREIFKTGNDFVELIVNDSCSNFRISHISVTIFGVPREENRVAKCAKSGWEALP